MIGKLIIRLFICVLIVTFWVQLLLFGWYLRLLWPNIPWDRQGAMSIFTYSICIFAPILLISAEALWNQRWVDIKGFYKNGLLTITLILALLFFYLASFFNQYILNGVILPNLAFMAAFALSLIFYLNIRSKK